MATDPIAARPALPLAPARPAGGRVNFSFLIEAFGALVARATFTPALAGDLDFLTFVSDVAMI